MIIKDNAPAGPIARLSRITYPRASAANLMLLSVVIAAIGAIAYILHPDAAQPAPNTFHGAALLVSNWLLCG